MRMPPFRVLSPKSLDEFVPKIVEYLQEKRYEFDYYRP